MAIAITASNFAVRKEKRNGEDILKGFDNTQSLVVSNRK